MSHSQNTTQTAVYDIETASRVSVTDVDTKSLTSGTPPEEARYPGSGTAEDPYIVDWDEGDPDNPLNWHKPRKWLITLHLAFATWVAAFCSSAYSSGLEYTMRDLHISREVALLGVSLFVLGFMRVVFIGTFCLFALLHIGGALCHNTATLLATRTLAGMFGVSPFTNAGAALADIWTARERGVASSLYASAPFLGPVLGPIVGGWVSMSRLGWHFVFWIMFILAIISLSGFVLVTPETYSPVLLRWRARRLRRESQGQTVYISRFDVARSRNRLANFRRNMARPFLFLATEPIVTLLAIYISIAYAILYAFFAAYPIVFEVQRGWSPGLAGLAFIGVGVGTTFGMCLAPVQNRLYWAALDRSTTGKPVPEARLYSPMFGGICLPIGLFWFAWTSDPQYHWIVPILAGAPFGTGVALVMQGLSQYLMDAYQMYGASALAATVVLRSVCAAIFPLVVPIMYANLGDAWACTIFAILVSVCMPLPFFFYKYGPLIRMHSKWALKDPLPVSAHVSAASVVNVVDAASISPSGVFAEKCDEKIS